MQTMVERRDTTISARIPKTLKKLIEKIVKLDAHINESDFLRDALREKVRRDVPSLYEELFNEAAK